MSVANRVDHLPVIDARRAMVITTNFPPDASVGTIRTLRLIRCLAHDGWHVDVITAAPERFRAGTVSDDALLQKIPSAVHVARVRAWRPLERLAAFVRGPARQSPATPSVIAASGDPASFAGEWSSQLVRAARACLALPDREVSWMLPAILAGWRWGHRHRPDVIYSSGPPFTAHLVGAALARLLRRPLVADFRDPWARAPWREDRFAFEKKVWSLLERLVVTRADAVLFATETNRREFKGQYGDAIASRFHVVANGCDVADFDGLTRSRNALDGTFVLLHAGSLYGARNPTPLLNAVANAVASGAIDRQRVRVRFIGRINVTGVSLPARVRELGLDDIVEFVSHLPRRAVLQEMLHASALLVVQPVTTLSVPAKLYEYMAARRPVLALAEPGGETWAVVHNTGAGIVVRADDEEAIQQALVSLVTGHEPPARVDPTAYDGALRAREAVRILNELATRGADLRLATVQRVKVPKAARGEVTHS